MLELGSSKPWPEAMELMTGQRSMSAEALMEYFQPLTDWLKEQNKGHPVGWKEACPEGSLLRDGDKTVNSGTSRASAAVTLMILSVLSFLSLLSA